MHVIVVVAHPEPGSFTHALAGEFVRGLAGAGHTHEFVDLYQEQFNPVADAVEFSGWARRQVPADVAAYQQRLRDAGAMALIYPIWWATPPAILQGWLQRVLTQGFAFDYREGRPQGLLQHRVQLIINIGTRDATHRARYIDPVLGVLDYCGVLDIRTLVNWGIYPGANPQLLQERMQAAFAAGQSF